MKHIPLRHPASLAAFSSTILLGASSASAVGATVSNPSDTGSAVGGLTISTVASPLAWVALVVAAAFVVTARAPVARATAALSGGALLALLGAPLHVAGALVVLAIACLPRRTTWGPGLLAGTAVLASMPGVVAETLARLDAIVVGTALPWLGIAARVDDVVVTVGGHRMVVDPACAAVEGIVVAFAVSTAVRALLGESRQTMLQRGALHALVFALANVARIAAVGVALAVAPDTAELVHAVGGPLLVLFVHVPFLADPVRRLALQARARSTSASRSPAAGLLAWGDAR
jgi:exosortase/archaeosortase family protein